MGFVVRAHSVNGRLQSLFARRHSSVVLILLLGLFGQPCFGQMRSVSFFWNPNPESDLAGYRLYYGEQSRRYTMVTALPATTQATIPGLVIGRKYYFALTAVNTAGIESDFSNELALDIPSLNTAPLLYGL